MRKIKLLTKVVRLGRFGCRNPVNDLQISMIQKAKWQPVDDIDSPFHSICFSFKDNSLEVRMVGNKTLVLQFSGVVAIRFEQECPGFDFPPGPAPIIRKAEAYPLLIIEGCPWFENFKLIYKDARHFGLIS